MIWSLFGLSWLVRETFFDPEEDYKIYDFQNRLITTVIASISLDLIFACSEIYHRFRLFLLEAERRKSLKQVRNNEIEMRNWS